MKRGLTSSDLGLAATLGVLAVLAARDIWWEIGDVAIGNAEQSHILMALPVAAWLAWLRRGRLRLAEARPSFLGPALVGAGWLSMAAGFRLGVDIAEHLGALALVGGAVLTVLGPRLLVHMAAPVGALLFLLPVPGTLRHPIAFHLQELSARAAEWIIEILGIPVARAGNLLTVNDVDVLVAEACNGMRMVSALALICYGFVFSVPMRNKVRVFLLALSPAVALFVNVVRLVPTALFYGYTSSETATLAHDVSGWLVLLVALAILWLELRVLRWLDVRIEPYAIGTEGR